MTKKSLPIVDSNPPAEPQPEISSRELLAALLDNRCDDVAKMLAADPRLCKSRDASGASAIQLAVYHQLDDMLDTLLAVDPELDVFEAAAVGEPARVQWLVSTQPSLVTETSLDGFTALGLAAFFGREEVLEWLLANGADVGQAASNPMRTQPLHSAAAHRQPEVALSMVQKLLQAGADVEAQQAGGFRPLHQAAAAGHEAMAMALLDHGADTQAVSDLGVTPAELARERGHIELAERLEARS